MVEATGLSRKALYAQWPDKTLVAAATLELYEATVLRPLPDLLLPQGCPALGDFWQALGAAIEMPAWNGCMLNMKTRLQQLLAQGRSC